MYELAKPKDVVIIDNSACGELFPVLRVPNESDLEDFYKSLGAKTISRVIKKVHQVENTSSDTPNTACYCAKNNCGTMLNSCFVNRYVEADA